MSGCWVLVCGPSGAGKDAVLDWARQALREHPGICFAQRVVTRPSREGAEHEEVAPAAMEELRRAGALAWDWEAHGYRYGVRAEYEARMLAGEVVVVNGSREHARSLARRPDLRCVLVTAPPSLLQARLHQRGREDPRSIALRMARNTGLASPFADCVIHNGGALAQAGGQLRDYLVDLAG